MNVTRIKYFDYLITLAAYFFISFAILGNILLSPGTIGFFHDWFIGPFHELNETWAQNGPYAWDSQLGNKVYYTDWLFRLILGLLPSPFLGGELLSKGLLILSITLSGFGAYCLGRRLRLSPYASFAAGILYIFSPLIFTRIIAGYIYYLIAYFLSPLIVGSFLKGREENNTRYFVIAALLLSFAAIQLQFLVMIFLILLVFSFIDFKRIKKSIIGLFIIFSLTILIILSPILLSQFLVKKSEIPFNPTQLLSYFTVATASDLVKSFRILGYEGMPYSYLKLGTSNDIITSNAGILPPWIFYLDFLLPVIGFSVLFFRRDKYTISFAIISLIGLFFLKGTNPPFSGLFVFLFTHGFYIFRELWHIAFLYSFAITFLVAFFIERLIHLKSKRIIKVSLSGALVAGIVISNGYALLLGNFAGYLQTYDFPNEYHTLYNKVLSDYHYNVLILPYINPIRYDNLRLSGLDPLITDTPSMIFPTILGNRASPTLSASTWLLSSMQDNMTHNLGKLLSGFGIKYVILRHGFISNYPDYTPLGSLSSFRERWYASLEPLLNAQKDMKIISNNTHYKVYENLIDATKIFAPSISAGGLSDFDSLLLISNVTSLSNVAFYQSISNNNSLLFVDDLVESNMSAFDFLDLGKYAVTFNAQSGWTTNRIAFGYDHVLASRVNEGLFTASPNSEVSFDLPSKYNNKHVELWIKALVWNQGGPINIHINEEKRLLPLLSPDRSLHIFKIFEGQSGMPYHISIKNIHGRNFIEGIYVKDKSPQFNVINNKLVLFGTRNQNVTNLMPISAFSFANNQSALPPYWDDRLNTCGRVFTCKINVTTGWDDNSSIQFSTRKPHNTNNTWSWIYGQPIDVNPKEKYQLLAHMKLNIWATQSHVTLIGSNETSTNWHEITVCPPESKGPLQWQEFSCALTIPENTTKIRPILNAGWSSQPQKVARTWFDAIYLNKIKETNDSSKVYQIKQLIAPLITQNSSSTEQTTTRIREYNKINPTLWNLDISTLRPTTIAFAEPYDQSWEATIYKDGKKIDTANSMPLYGVINSFQIKKTGDLNIVLRFVPQFWYYVGFVISGLTIAVCLFYIVYDYRKNSASSSFRATYRV